MLVDLPEDSVVDEPSTFKAVMIGDCFCAMGKRHPMYKEHTRLCLEIQDRIAKCQAGKTNVLSHVPVEAVREGGV